MTVYGNSSSAGGGLVQLDCRGEANQSWYVDFPFASVGGDELVWLRAATGDLYVDVPGNSIPWGTQLVQCPS